MSFKQRLSEAFSDEITPIYNWRQNGDGSWTVRIEYTPKHIFVYTNKKRQNLEKIVKERYGPKTFWD